VFYGLGSDGTVGANKNSIKIIGEETDNYAQGYFVYDSKKAGAVTISHLRFGPKPIRSTYLIGDNEAELRRLPPVPTFLEKLRHARQGRSPAAPSCSTRRRRRTRSGTPAAAMQQQIIDKGSSFYVIDAYRIAEQAGMGRRINTIMQTCFFAISGILPKDEAIAQIKEGRQEDLRQEGREAAR
jgi:pyruvate-ferredoxin/flavodoxin oxidoreductase